ncbi:MAG: PHP domain-containing protein [Candidatus Nanoarchaeia archaeon]
MKINLRNDFHAHSNRSYCCVENLSAIKYLEIIQAGKLDSIAITDHSMAIYFPPEIACEWEYIANSSIFDSYRDTGNKNLDAHLSMLESLANQGIIPGLETEMMSDGRFTFDPVFRKRIQILIGSVHFLPVEGASQTDLFQLWKKHTLNLINSGIDVLGHPFRWIENFMRVDYNTVREIILEAKKADVAIELNGHYIIQTDKIMLLTCIETGTKISFGSDSHNLKEAGNLAYHEKLLSEVIEENGIKLQDINFFNPLNDKEKK